MNYLCLVYLDEQKISTCPPDQWVTLQKQSAAYDETLRQSGHLILCRPLQPVAAAKTLQVRNDQLSIVDGPFAETKEHLGGFILIEVRDEEEALRIAAKIPLATFGRVEIRPTMAMA